MRSLCLAVGLLAFAASGCARATPDDRSDRPQIVSVESEAVVRHLKGFGYGSWYVYASWQSLDGSKVYFQEPITDAGERPTWLMDAASSKPSRVVIGPHDVWIDPQGKPVGYPPYVTRDDCRGMSVDPESGYFCARSDGSPVVRVGYLSDKSGWLFEADTENGTFVPDKIACADGRVLLLKGTDSIHAQPARNCLVARRGEGAEGKWTFERITLNGGIRATLGSDPRVLVQYRSLMLVPLRVSTYDLARGEYDVRGFLKADHHYFLLKDDWLSKQFVASP